MAGAAVACAAEALSLTHLVWPACCRAARASSSTRWISWARSLALAYSASPCACCMRRVCLDLAVFPALRCSWLPGPPNVPTNPSETGSWRFFLD